MSVELLFLWRYWGCYVLLWYPVPELLPEFRGGVNPSATAAVYLKCTSTEDFERFC